MAKIRLTQKPYKEPYCLMPDEDYENEGLKFFDEHPEFLTKELQQQFKGCEGSWLDAFEDCRNNPDVCFKEMWVIRFEVISIMPKLPDNLFAFSCSHGG